MGAAENEIFIKNIKLRVVTVITDGSQVETSKVETLKVDRTCRC